MSAMASQITSHTSVYLTVCSAADKKTRKLRVAGLCEGKSSGNGEFPSQTASNAENNPFDDVIMISAVVYVAMVDRYQNTETHKGINICPSKDWQASVPTVTSNRVFTGANINEKYRLRFQI